MKISASLALTILGAMLAPAAAAGETQTAPFDQVLDVLPVQLELSDCRIDIEIHNGVEPLLRVLTDPAGGGEAPAFDVSLSGGRIRIARSDDAGTTDAAATVELVLDASQALEVRGAGLAISVRSATPPEPSDSPALPTGGDGSQPGVFTVLQSYDLVDSEISIAGTPAASIVATNSAVLAQGGAGDLTVELERGSLTVRKHEGNLRLSASDSQCTVEDLEGAVQLQLQGGNLDLRDGSGAVQGEVQSGHLSFDHWTGNAGLVGEDATIELRDGAMDQVRLSGTATEVTIDDLRGSVTAQITGGRLTADAIRGRLETTASADARVEIADHDGAAMVTLKDDSTAEVTDILGAVTCSVEQSELILTNAESLELTARAARITLAGVRRIGKLDARASELELDLRAVESNRLDLRVTDDSSAAVELPSPCRVQLRESVAASQQIDVTGCEFQMQSAGRWRGSQLHSLDGRPPFMFTAKVSESGYLRVRGGP